MSKPVPNTPRLFRTPRRLAAAAAAAIMVTAGGAYAPPEADALIYAVNAAPGVMAESSARLQLGDMACTATLISPDSLLTAKHCLGRGTNSFISIGAAHRGELHQAREVILHPDVDLAIVKLDRPSGKPWAPLSGRHLDRGMWATAVGWGGTGNNPFLPVQQADLEVQRRVFHVPSPEPDAVLIETWVHGGRIQRGDSGGPLFFNGQLAGIAAMSNEGANHTVDGNVGWYVPVAEHLDWIHRHSGAPIPPVEGVPSPLVDARLYPTFAPPTPPPGPLEVLRQLIPGLPHVPGLSS